MHALHAPAAVAHGSFCVKNNSYVTHCRGTNQHCGSPNNPWGRPGEEGLVCGGSSSGSGASVASGMVPCAGTLGRVVPRMPAWFKCGHRVSSDCNTLLCPHVTDSRTRFLRLKLARTQAGQFDCPQPSAAYADSRRPRTFCRPMAFSRCHIRSIR